MKNLPNNIKLSVNLNKLILLRNARESDKPDPVEFAQIALENGASGITLHPRSDERHTKCIDVQRIAEYIHLKKPQCEFNIEGNPFSKIHSNNQSFMDLVLAAEPHQCTLVPDDENQITSDHGWDLSLDNKKLSQAINRLKKKKIRVSLFVDPDCTNIQKAKAIGADRIEIYTEKFANAFGTEDEYFEYKKCVKLAEEANQHGLDVNAGHDLNLKNLTLLKNIKQIKEVSIGQALIIDALYIGFVNAVRAYNNLLNP